MQISDKIIKNHLNCQFKSLLELHSVTGDKTDYENLLNRLEERYKLAALTKLKNDYSSSNISHLTQVEYSDFKFGSSLILGAYCTTGEFQSEFDALKLSTKLPSSYEPVICCFHHKVSINSKLLLTYKGIVLEQLQETFPSNGYIIFGNNYSMMKISLPHYKSRVETIIKSIKRHPSDINNFLPFLNNHCDICEYNKYCMEKALKCDHLSLLKGISPKEVNKHNNRGIFSVHQLSYTFRPRKTPKRTKNPGKPRYFSLQALALRENSIYVHNLPDMQDAETKVYYDIESLPHRNFYYLIGALICSPKTTKYRYFWANENKDQEKVIIDFIQYFQEITNCRFYHYGSYDVNALKKIKGKLEEQPTLDLEKIINNSVNVLSSIYPHVYFPTYSNKLKDISKILDCNWSAHNSSGINSIVWREKWEAGQEPIYKERLIQYNQEDCKALKAICDFLVKIKQSTSKELSINEQVVVRRAPEAKHTYNNRNLFRKPEYAVGYFKKISSCAYFDYQREKVFVRSNKSFTKKNKLKKKRTRFLNQPNKFVEIECTECPRCGRTRKGIKKCHEIQKDIIDLNFSSNGVRKRVTRYSSWRYMCNKCYREFNSQRWPTGRKRYGHQLMSWCVYNNIARKQKMLQVYQGLSDLFGLRMPSECLYRFKTYMANHYKKTYEEILAEILKSPVIHIDETTVNLKSDKGYVWVMTSINLVYYFYRESREGSFLKEMLSEFSGVLISDFYTAYDSIPCKHQKCLIHLIRDINDDLLKNPFDDELKKLGENFGKLLKNIVSTIDSFGLKKKELKIHKSEALHFLDDVCEKEYSSEIASNYQKRFNKNRNDLFRFLNYDNVAWNNNNVEHAINWFARYRRFAGGLFTKRSLEELLLLLSVIQTCEYNDINVLKFLLTGKKGVRSITRNYS